MRILLIIVSCASLMLAGCVVPPPHGDRGGYGGGYRGPSYSSPSPQGGSFGGGPSHQGGMRSANHGGERR